MLPPYPCRGLPAAQQGSAAHWLKIATDEHPDVWVWIRPMDPDQKRSLGQDPGRRPSFPLPGAGSRARPGFPGLPQALSPARPRQTEDKGAPKARGRCPLTGTKTDLGETRGPEWGGGSGRWMGGCRGRISPLDKLVSPAGSTELTSSGLSKDN